MAKNQSAGVNSFAGIFAPDTAKQEQEPVQVKPIQPPKTVVKEIKPEPKAETKDKKRGRPKANRETKQRTTFTILPSVCDKAAELVYEEGKSMSELVEELLIEYINQHYNQD